MPTKTAKIIASAIASISENIAPAIAGNASASAAVASTAVSPGDLIDDISETITNINGLLPEIPFGEGAPDEMKEIWVIFVSIAALFSAISILLSGIHIFQHLRYYTRPLHQKYIIRIVFMVPVYSVVAMLSLTFRSYRIYFEVARTFYEAYGLYSFFVLCVNYAGGEENLLRSYLGQPPRNLAIPCCCIAFQPNEKSLRWMRGGVLQYVVISIGLAIAIVFCEAFGVYAEGEYNPAVGSYFYVNSIWNVSVSVALYALVMFYVVTEAELKPYKPMMKFICIKIIVFFCFWQDVIISLLVAFNLFPERYLEPHSLSNLLVCIEMTVISIFHQVAYPYDLYKVETLSQAPLVHEVERKDMMSAISGTISQADVLKDTIRTFKIQGKKSAPPANGTRDGEIAAVGQQSLNEDAPNDEIGIEMSTMGNENYNSGFVDIDLSNQDKYGIELSDMSHSRFGGGADEDDYQAYHEESIGYDEEDVYFDDTDDTSLPRR